jgi:trans-aconitate 2-methyltransferase
VLEALPDPLRSRFETEYGARLREAYPEQPHGTVLPFRRVFCVVHREDGER